jgi:hypothetical protein
MPQALPEASVAVARRAHRAGAAGLRPSLLYLFTEVTVAQTKPIASWRGSWKCSTARAFSPRRRGRSSTSQRVRCTPGGTRRRSQPGRCCSSLLRGSMSSSRKRGYRATISPPCHRLRYQRTCIECCRSDRSTLLNIHRLPPGKITVSTQLCGR